MLLSSITPSANPQAVIDELEKQGGCTVIRNGKNLESPPR